METRVGWWQRNQKWINVIVCAFMIFVSLGFYSSNKSLYMKAVTDANNIPRSIYSLAYSCRFIATSVTNIFFGYLVYKFGTKKLILGGFVFLICAAILDSVGKNVFVFYLAATLSGIGFSFCGTAMVGGIINRWCKENTGTIMGAVLAVNGIGGALAAQIVSPIINEAGNPFGYQNAYKLVAVILLFAAILIAVFFKEKPRGEADDAPAHAKKKKRGRQWVGVDYNIVKKKAYFYGAAVCIFFTGMILQGVGSINAPHYADVGIDNAYIASIASVSSLCLAGSKFVAGFLYDKVGLRKTITICNCAACISMITMGLADNSAVGRALAMSCGVFSAIALPLETIMLPLYAADLFGEKSYNKILGLFVSFNTAGYAVGSPLINSFYDLTGSYKTIIFILAGIMAIVMLTLQFVITGAHKVRDEILEAEQSRIPVNQQASIEA